MSQVFLDVWTELCVPPKFICWCPNPQGERFGGRACRGQLSLNEVIGWGGECSLLRCLVNKTLGPLVGAWMLERKQGGRKKGGPAPSQSTWKAPPVSSCFIIKLILKILSLIDKLQKYYKLPCTCHRESPILNILPLLFSSFFLYICIFNIMICTLFFSVFYFAEPFESKLQRSRTSPLIFQGHSFVYLQENDQHQETEYQHNTMI